MLSKRKLSSSASRLNEPLIQDKSDVPASVVVDINADQNRRTRNDFVAKRDVVTLIAVCLLATVGFAASAAAMILNPTMLVFMAGVLCCLNALTFLHRHFIITNTSVSGLCSSIDLSRKQVGVLKEQINILSNAADKLKDEVDNLKWREQKLHRITEQQETSVTNMVKLVKENESILDGMKHNLCQIFTETTTKLILLSCKDGDMKVSLKEGHRLALRLKIELKPHGIDVDTEKFYQMLEEEKEIIHIIRFCAKVLYPEVVVETLKKYNASKQSARRSQNKQNVDGITGSSRPLNNDMSEEDLKQELENNKMSFEDKLEMFRISNNYSRGSVEVARGKKMSILPYYIVRNNWLMRINNMVEETKRRVSELEKRDTY